MQKNNNIQQRWIWVSVLVLFVCVTTSTYMLINRLDSFLLDDSGAIPLIPEEQTAAVTEENRRPQAADNGEQPSEEPVRASLPQTETPARPEEAPGLEASDDQTVWDTDTQVEIFRVSYENGEREITVNSDDGDKLIAPGTENAYTFKLKNTGNVALDYTVTVDAYVTPVDTPIPVTARLSRYDGKWLAGDQDSFGDILALDGAEDAATLGAGRYTYYTLDWLWPFESGNDALDTQLGDTAVEQDLTFTIVIHTTAVCSDDPDSDGGIMGPVTGDDSNVTLWMILAVSSFGMMVLLLFYQGKEKRRSDAEAQNVETNRKKKS